MAALFFLGLWISVVLCYLASAHQRLLMRALPAGPARAVAAALAVLALLAGWSRFGPMAGSFMALAWAMLWLGVWPLVPVVAGRSRA